MDMFKYFLLIKNARKNTQFRSTQSLNWVLLNFESVLNLYNFEGYKPLSQCMLQPCPWQSVPHCEQEGLQVPLHTQRDDVQLLHGGGSSHWQTLVLHSGHVINTRNNNRNGDLDIAGGGGWMGFLRGRLSRGVQLSQRVETPSVGLLPGKTVSCESNSRTSRPSSIIESGL